jgi:hypothetical protein
MKKKFFMAAFTIIAAGMLTMFSGKTSSMKVVLDSNVEALTANERYNITPNGDVYCENGVVCFRGYQNNKNFWGQTQAGCNDKNGICQLNTNSTPAADDQSIWKDFINSNFATQVINAIKEIASWFK